MNNLIIESIGRPIEVDFSKTSVAHARNAVIIAQLIGADIVTGEKDMHLAEGVVYNNIICSYASPYMKYKKLIDIVRNSPDAKLWWLVNDHDLEDNILLRNILKETKGKRKINMICNNARSSYRGWILRKKIRDEDRNILGILDDFIDEWHTVNLNSLICSYQLPYKWEDKTEDCVYFGTMRKWRLDDLIMYQDSGITLSATPRTQKKFVLKGVENYKMIDKLSWMNGNETLGKFKASLYIEDIHTHDHYAHMANRFYEGLMCNTITFFDSKCRENIEKSNFDIDEFYIVDTSEELKRKVDYLRLNSVFENCLEDNNKHILVAFKERVEAETQIRAALGMEEAV